MSEYDCFKNTFSPRLSGHAFRLPDDFYPCQQTIDKVVDIINERMQAAAEENDMRLWEELAEVRAEIMRMVS